MTPLLTIVAVVFLAVLVLLAGLLLFTYQLASKLLRPVRRAMTISPADVGLQMSAVRISSPRGTLAGWYLPSHNGCTLICCHGINDNSGQWIAPVARLHAYGGYGALLFDFSGHGQSEGNQVTYGIRERQDVTAVLEYLRQRGDVNMDRVAILGNSLGAITAVMAAVEHPTLRAVVIESGFSDLHHDIAKIFARYTGLPAFPFVRLVIFWGQRIAHLRLSEVRPARIIGMIAPRPVLIISDLRDALADEPYDGECLYRAAGNPKELWQVAEATHVNAFGVDPETWVEHVGGFLDAYVAASAASVERSGGQTD
jgi:pimeloyl-ACP methyl ester carboxylesterase